MKSKRFERVKRRYQGNPICYNTKKKKKNHFSSLWVLVGLTDMKSDCQLSMISDLQISEGINIIN